MKENELTVNKEPKNCFVNGIQLNRSDADKVRPIQMCDTNAWIVAKD